MNINWYPGHMKKTKETIEKRLPMIDIVYEVLDARIPISSKNPMIDEIIGDKPRILILNKKDLADPNINQKWINFYRSRDLDVIAINSKVDRDVKELISITDKIIRERDRGTRREEYLNKDIRAMIVGIPNVGKSTLINTLTGRKGAKVGNRPGVTKSDQWIKTKSNLQLLDTPGILWPKFEDKQVGMNLAFIGSIRDQVIDIETLCLRLIEYLSTSYPELLEERYGLVVDGLSGLEIMEEIGRKRGCIIRGGEIDYTRVSNIILDEYRNGVLGSISLEKPESVVE